MLRLTYHTLCCKEIGVGGLLKKIKTLLSATLFLAVTYKMSSRQVDHDVNNSSTMEFVDRTCDGRRVVAGRT